MESHIERFCRMDGQPLVSIVVLNCNGANWLPKCFGSIKAQTILNQIETVLVDNHSSDDSVAVARRLLQIFPVPSSCGIRRMSAFVRATIPGRVQRTDVTCCS